VRLLSNQFKPFLSFLEKKATLPPWQLFSIAWLVLLLTLSLTLLSCANIIIQTPAILEHKTTVIQIKRLFNLWMIIDLFEYNNHIIIIFNYYDTHFLCLKCPYTYTTSVLVLAVRWTCTARGQVCPKTWSLKTRSTRKSLLDKVLYDDC